MAVAAPAVQPVTHHNPAAILVVDPENAQVTSNQAFNTGAGNTDNGNIFDGNGNGAGSDSYTCYYGGWENYPPSSSWVEFDAMFNANKPAMFTGCGALGLSPEDTDEQVGQIWNAIQQIAEASLVDHRFILATIMQEVSFPPCIGCSEAHRFSPLAVYTSVRLTTG